jgi:hypothetical protein
MNIRAGLRAIAVGVVMMCGATNAGAVTYTLVPGPDGTERDPEMLLVTPQAGLNQTGTASEIVSTSLLGPSVQGMSAVSADDIDNLVFEGMHLFSIDALKKALEVREPASSR